MLYTLNQEKKYLASHFLFTHIAEPSSFCLDGWHSTKYFTEIWARHIAVGQFKKATAEKKSSSY